MSLTETPLQADQEKATGDISISTNQRGLLLLKEAPEWFLAIAALIYATGFLVTFTFFARLGIREAGTEFFKVKYVHVGILCFVTPALTAIPLYAWSYISRVEAEEEKSGKSTSLHVYLPSAILSLNLIATFYVYVMFAPPRYLRARGHVVPLIFAITLIGLAIARELTKKRFEVLVSEGAERISFSINAEKLGLGLRWALCIGVIFFLDRFAFRGLGRDLWEMFSGAGRFTSGGYIFLAFWGLTLWLVWRLNERSRTIGDGHLKTALWAFGSGILICTFYLCVLSFAYSVYPYIPAERGGGSYLDAAPVVLILQGPNVLPSDLMDTGSKSKPLIVVEETGSSVYVADPKDNGGPAEWRRGSLPRVVGVRRDNINSIEYLR